MGNTEDSTPTFSREERHVRGHPNSVNMPRMIRFRQASCLAALCGSGLFLSLGWPAQLEAQSADGDPGRVTTRADVQLEIESVPGTSRARLASLASVLSSRIGDLRRCYGDVISERPTVQGGIRARIQVQPNRRAAVEILEDTTGDEPLSECVQSTLRGADYRDVDTPAAAFASMEFRNSTAEGTAIQQQRAEEEAQVPIERDREGRPFVRGATGDDVVQFRITGEQSASPEMLRGMHATLRTTLPALMDCRRRASRRASPAGEFGIALRVDAQGRVQARTLESSVPAARRCVESVLRPLRFPAVAAGQVQLKIEFRGYSEAAPAR